MSYKFEEGKEEIIHAVVEKITQCLDEGQTEFCAEFAKQFYGTVALEDLLTWELDDLYGAVVNFWSLIKERKPHQTKIRIYNPEFERDGWQTTHTVVEVICDDMPFLVDSIRMVINRMNISSHLIVHMGGIRVKRDDHNTVDKILTRTASSRSKEVLHEAPIFLEIDRETNPLILEELQQKITKALEDNKMVFEDWEAMRSKVLKTATELDAIPEIGRAHV